MNLPVAVILDSFIQGPALLLRHIKHAEDRMLNRKNTKHKHLPSSCSGAVSNVSDIVRGLKGRKLVHIGDIFTLARDTVTSDIRVLDRILQELHVQVCHVTVSYCCS